MQIFVLKEMQFYPHLIFGSSLDLSGLAPSPFLINTKMGGGKKKKRERKGEGE